MIYGNDYEIRRIGGFEVIDYKELIERILSQPDDEDPKHLVMWATCLRQNDPGEKILRNIAPTLVYVTVKSEPSRYAHLPHHAAIIHELEVSDNAKRNKKIKLYTNNHGDLTLADLYDEAVRYYNRKVDHYLKHTREALKARTEYMEGRINELASFRIAGFILEEVISPTCRI